MSPQRILSNSSRLLMRILRGLRELVKCGILDCFEVDVSSLDLWQQ